MFAFGTRIILLLLFIGGVVALAGDYIGRAIGRKRLTFLNLRPRYTAMAVTILTGVLIALTTIGIILMVSQDARTALFGLQKLRGELSEKSLLLEKTKDELGARILEKEKIDREFDSAKTNLRRAKLEMGKLEKEIEISRKGEVLFKVGDTLVVSTIQAGPEKEKLEEGLKQILSAADAFVRNFCLEEEKHLIFISPEDFNQSVAELQKREGENIVRVIASRNTLWGEEVAVRFEIAPNKLVYNTDEAIAELLVSPSLSIPEIEQEIKKLLFMTHEAAKNKGVIPDPSGSLGSVPYSTILSLAKKIKGHKKETLLKTVAKKDIFTIGPLEIDFRVYNQ